MSANDLKAQMAEIWLRQRRTALDRVAELQRLLQTGGDSSLDKARELAHQLAGALGIFGLNRGSAIANELENMLRDRTGTNAQMRESIAELQKVIEKFGG